MFLTQYYQKIQRLWRNLCAQGQEWKSSLDSCDFGALRWHFIINMHIMSNHCMCLGAVPGINMFEHISPCHPRMQVKLYHTKKNKPFELLLKEEMMLHRHKHVPAQTILWYLAGAMFILTHQIQNYLFS